MFFIDSEIFFSAALLDQKSVLGSYQGYCKCYTGKQEYIFV